jgi:hypothetical protein
MERIKSLLYGHLNKSHHIYNLTKKLYGKNQKEKTFK